MKGEVVTHNFENGPTKDNFSSSFCAEDDFFSQNMHNLYNRLQEKFNRKAKKKCRILIIIQLQFQILSSFWLKIIQEFLFLLIAPSCMEGGAVRNNFEKGHQRIIPAKFDWIWLSGFWGVDFNVIFYQNMPNLHYRYNSDDRNISQRGLLLNLWLS